MKKALITGANGFIGSQLCKELIAHGIEVRALHRPSSNLSLLEGVTVERVIGDVTDRTSLEAAMRGVDTVYHMAALYREAKFGDEMYWNVNFEGTKNVVEVARTSGVSYLCYCSTTGVLGDIKNPPADESYPYGPLDVYQESKTEAEKYVLSAIRDGTIPGSVLRPAMVWGPHDTRLFKLFRGIAKRRLPIIGDGMTWCHWILIDDLVRAFRVAPTTPASRGQLYIIAGERPVSLKYTMERIAQELGVSLLPFTIPVLPFQLLGDLCEAICSPLGIEPPIHRRRADFFIKNRCFNVEKCRNELQIFPTYTFEAEVKYIVDWYKSHGWL